MSISRKNQRTIANDLVIDWSQVERSYVELSGNEQKCLSLTKSVKGIGISS